MAGDRGWLINVIVPVFIPHDAESGATCERDAIAYVKEGLRLYPFSKAKLDTCEFRVKYEKG